MAEGNADRRPSPAPVGLSTAVTQFAYALAPALLGTIRDLTGGYMAVLLVCIGLQLAETIVILAGNRFAKLPAV